MPFALSASVITTRGPAVRLTTGGQLCAHWRQSRKMEADLGRELSKVESCRQLEGPCQVSKQSLGGASRQLFNPSYSVCSC